jgi:hypothetical protein
MPSADRRPTSASDSVDIQVPSDIESRNPQIDSLVTARAGDGDAALSEIVRATRSRGPSN